MIYLKGAVQTIFSKKETVFKVQYDAISIRTKWRRVYIRDKTRSEQKSELRRF